MLAELWRQLMVVMKESLQIFQLLYISVRLLSANTCTLTQPLCSQTLFHKPPLYWYYDFTLFTLYIDL